MDSAEISVLTGGVASIGFVLWYFFGEREAVAAHAGEGGVQEVKITVKGGYSPDVVVVKQGSPVRLDFYRDETADTSDRVVLEAFGIDRPLPAFEATAVEFTPPAAGEFPFRCGQATLRGLLVVEPAAPARPVASPHKHHG